MSDDSVLIRHLKEATLLHVLIEYLRSRESSVGPLNNRLEKNMLHGRGDDAISLAVADEAGEGGGEVTASEMEKRKRDDEEEGSSKRKARTA